MGLRPLYKYVYSYSAGIDFIRQRVRVKGQKVRVKGQRVRVKGQRVRVKG